MIEKLGNEEVNWRESLKKNRQDKLSLVGDIVISSGIIAYLGVFSLDYRLEAIENWIGILKSFEILSSENFSLIEVLGNKVKLLGYVN